MSTRKTTLFYALLIAVSSTIVGMVTKLQDLVGTIRQHSHDASAMAQSAMGLRTAFMVCSKS